MNNKRLYFYAPGDNSYAAPCDLWYVSKNSVRDNGIGWLEPVWKNGPKGQLLGLILFCSKLDAHIYAMVLNEDPEEAWNVYPFSDISVTEMMIDMASQQDEYIIHIIFGFGVDELGHVKYKKGALTTVSFTEHFKIIKDSSALSPIVLRFSDVTFKERNKYWKDCYIDCCNERSSQEIIQNHELMNIAITDINRVEKIHNK